MSPPSLKPPLIRSSHAISPFQLPVAMLFPAKDKRPLEFDLELTPEKLLGFVEEHATTLKAAAQKSEL